MFKRLLLRFRDMKTIGKLIPGAEEQANIMGEEKPGAEHFVLSALNLEDGTAKRVFDKFGIDANKFKSAIKAQYDEALSSIGISGQATEITPEPIKSDKILLDSHPSGQDLMKSLYALKKEDNSRPLQSAHVIIVAASIKHGVVPRAFKVLGVDNESLAKAARDELLSI
ncbi:Clp protease N-terminal domain-containing protein [Vibrio mangrovi]|uniref:Clp amino terminal domain protein n=1 Tax=Vibrio mangrovi TaxID=474394 RepID=A0A1Y6IXE9_9VIBR|nr:Clp protease N-terminal domain-containing protein [Vibrio mangrovi]MDW6002833.1 Clp protease N-terminal domain-containing protein [Vibrio mangrovi]SMS02324.1 Clp amino terminal domain protein [Vibrio mangrovi]